MNSVFSEKYYNQVQFPNLYHDPEEPGFNVGDCREGEKVVHINPENFSTKIFSPSSSHRATRGIPAQSGIYKFEVNIDTDNFIYIGKAVDLKKRFAIYLKNVRHLLLIHEGHQTKPSRNPFRCIHYVLAKAAINKCRIPSDHIPIRSWPLFLARELMRDLIETLKAEQST